MERGKKGEGGGIGIGRRGGREGGRMVMVVVMMIRGRREKR